MCLLSQRIVPHPAEHHAVSVPSGFPPEDLMKPGAHSHCQFRQIAFCWAVSSHHIADASRTPFKAHTHHTLRSTFACAGVASSSRGPHHIPTPFKFVQVLAALGRPDAALAVLRARAHVSSTVHQSSEEAFQEAQTALSIRLQCGVFTEACSEV